MLSPVFQSRIQPLNSAASSCYEGSVDRGDFVLCGALPLRLILSVGASLVFRHKLVFQIMTRSLQALREALDLGWAGDAKEAIKCRLVGFWQLLVAVLTEIAHRLRRVPIHVGLAVELSGELSFRLSQRDHGVSRELLDA